MRPSKIHRHNLAPFHQASAAVQNAVPRRAAARLENFRSERGEGVNIPHLPVCVTASAQCSACRSAPAGWALCEPLAGASPESHHSQTGIGIVLVSGAGPGQAGSRECDVRASDWSQTGGDTCGPERWRRKARPLRRGDYDDASVRTQILGYAPVNRVSHQRTG